jgi:type IV secretion system protein VirD4
LTVSRQETARALLTSGEVMQLPPQDAIVLVAGAPPIRARKIRYYVDTRLAGRVRQAAEVEMRPLNSGPSLWSAVMAHSTASQPTSVPAADEGGLKHEPELTSHEMRSIEPAADPVDLEPQGEGDEAQQGAEMRRRFLGVARHAAIGSYLSPDAAEVAEAATTRRLDRLARQFDRLET